MQRKAVSLRSPSDFENDICLSFAGEDRPYVKEVAEGLRKKGVRVFFDEYEKATLWGKDLYVHLDEVYQKSAYYCVLFASRAYAKKLWTNHERMSAQARAFQQSEEYILPARFDKSEIPGLRPTVGYIDLSTTTAGELVDLIVDKLGSRVFSNFLPPDLDLLHDAITPNNKKVRARVARDARYFFHTLQRMTPEERKLLFQFFHDACEHELPDNVHIETDLLCRESNFPISKIRRILNGISSLGFRCSERKHKSSSSKSGKPALELEWHNLSLGADEDSNSTFSAYMMVNVASEGRCETCHWMALDNLDFSSLSSATIVHGHIHE